MERSLVLIKPDAMERGLGGTIVGRLQQQGLKLRALKMLKIDRALAQRHYGVHRDKPFFESLVEYITSAPVVALVLEGEVAVSRIRAIMGATNPKEAAPGTIRSDFGIDIQSNATHASDAPETGEQEVALFFTPQEICG